MVLVGRIGVGAMTLSVMVACGAEIERGASSGSGSPGGAPATSARVEPPGTCENFSLHFGPATLPPASKGTTYEVALRTYADREWRGLQYKAASLPPGLALATSPVDALVLRGVPITSGVFDFDVYAIHGSDSNGCSTMPDPHKFHLEIGDGDAGADAAVDGD